MHMVGYDQDNYDKLDIDTLSNILRNPDSPPIAHQMALAALTKIEKLQRTKQLVLIMEGISRYPTRYDVNVMMDVVDALATDPDPYAMSALIEGLSSVSESFLTDAPVNPEYREYYYRALLTRQRDEDLAVWGEMLPQLAPATLVAIATDPVAKPLEALEPMTLIDRLDEPARTRSFMQVIDNAIAIKASGDVITEAAKALRKQNDQEMLHQMIDTLGNHMDNVTGSGSEKRAKVKMYMKVLKALDNRPRSAAERLRGKRPWAS